MSEFGKQLEGFVREALSLPEHVLVERCRVSGGVNRCPVIDLRLVMCAADSELFCFVDTQDQSADQLIYLISTVLAERDEPFVGSVCELRDLLVDRDSALSDDERRAVPAAQWMGRILSSLLAVGCETLALDFKRFGMRREWSVSIREV